MNLFGWFKRSKMKREIIINVEKLETRVAVVENGRLEEYMVEHPEEERLVGSVFKGRVQNLENDLQAAFVDIGLKKNAFLHYWDMTPDADALLDDDDEPRPRGQKGGRKANRLSDEEIAKRFPPGSEIIVQVTKGPISTKGPRVTANLSIPGRLGQRSCCYLLPILHHSKQMNLQCNQHCRGFEFQCFPLDPQRT